MYTCQQSFTMIFTIGLGTTRLTHNKCSEWFHSSFLYQFLPQTQQFFLLNTCSWHHIT